MTFLRIWLWSAIAACLLAFSVAEEKFTREKIAFLNFSEEPVAVNYVDTNGSLQEIAKVDAYDSFSTYTISGHLFQYTWKDASTYYRAHSTSGINVNDGEADLSNLAPQVHVLGGMDQPETKRVVCGTTKGDIHINIKPFWAPLGALRFLHLSHTPRFFDGCALNRVIPNFLTQFGIGSNYAQRSHFRNSEREIFDDPQLEPPIHFRPGMISFAGKGPNTRSAEVFIVMPDATKETLNFFGKDNSWETPFGYVDPDDLQIVGSWQSYGDMPPWGNGPDPQKIYAEDGYKYLENQFAGLDYIKGCAIIPGSDMNDPMITGMSYTELADYVFADVEAEEL